LQSQTHGMSAVVELLTETTSMLETNLAEEDVIAR